MGFLCGVALTVQPPNCLLVKDALANKSPCPLCFPVLTALVQMDNTKKHKRCLLHTLLHHPGQHVVIRKTVS